VLRRVRAILPWIQSPNPCVQPVRTLVSIFVSWRA